MRPEINYKKARLVDIAELRRGTEPGSATYCDPPAGIRFLRVGDISAKVDKPVNTRSGSVTLAKESDILMSFDGTPGIVARGFKGAISSAIRVVEPNEAKVSKDYLYYYLQSPEVQETIKRHSIGATIIHASRAIPNIEVPIPPLGVQGQIARILHEVDVLRKKRELANQFANRIIQSIFLKMFGDPRSNLKGWKTRELQEVSNISRGKFTPRPRSDPKYFGGDHPFIQTGDISGSNHRLYNYTQTLNELGAKVSKRFRKETVVIAIVGATIGETAILKIDTYATDSVIGIVPNMDYLNPEYLEMVLRFWKPIFKIQAPETARANINNETLKSVRIPLPPIELQGKFASIVKKIERVVEYQEHSSAGISKLFRSLMHKAFRGELKLAGRTGS